MQFLGSNEKELEARAYIGWETPLSPLGGGGRQAPCPRPGTSLQIQKKYIKVMLPVAWATGVLSPLGRATGGYFRKFSKRTYIIEIFIFFKYKKEKDAMSMTRSGR